MKDAAGAGAANGSSEVEAATAAGGLTATVAIRSKFCQGMSDPPKDDLDCRRPLGIDFEPDGNRVGVYTGPAAEAGSTGRKEGEPPGEASSSRGALPGTVRSDDDEDDTAGGRRPGVLTTLFCSV